MRIAVTYEEGQVFQHFGKTSFFKFYDIEGSEVVSTRVSDTGGASHHDLAVFLQQNGVDAVICGGLGQGMINALSMCGIAVYAGAVGDADEAVKRFLHGGMGMPTMQGSCTCHDHEHGDHHCGGHC